MINHFTFFFFFWFSFSVSAQDPSYFIIGADDLANIDVYTLLYDDPTDILYIGTNRGVYKYAQNKFVELKGDKNQIGDSFLHLTKDRNGSIFCCNLSGQVFKVEEDHISLFNESVKSGEFSRTFTFFFDNENNLITTSYRNIRKISPAGEETVLFDSTGICSLPPRKRIAAGILNRTYFKHDSVYFSLTAENGLFMTYRNGELSYQNLPTNLNTTRPIFCSFNNNIFLKFNRFFYNLNTGKQSVDTVESDSYVEIFQLDKNHIIERKNGGGIRFLKYSDGTIQEVKTSFQNDFISKIAVNDNNTLFLGTFKEGIIVVSNWKNEKNVSSQSYSGIVSSPDNDVFLSNRKGEIFKDENGPKLHLKKEGNIDELFYLNGSYFLGEFELSEILFKSSNNYTKHFVAIKDLVEVEDNFVIWTDGVGIYFLSKDILNDPPPKYDMKRAGEYYTILPQRRSISVQFSKTEQTIYYATNSGLFSRKWNSSVSKPLLLKDEAVLGNDLEIYHDELIVATEKEGLIFYHLGKFQRRITKNDGLFSNTLLKLKLKDNLLFILGKNGLQVYDLRQQEFREFGLNEGLMTDRVINFSLSNDKLWILDKKGYYSIELKNIDEPKRIKMGKIYLDSILINNAKVDLGKRGLFSYDQDEFQVFFDYRDIETKGETKIFYKLEGVSTSWKTLETSTNYIEFPTLPPGDYTFLIKAKFRNQESKVIEYAFSILPPFWLRWWFITLCIVLISLTVYLLFSIQLRRLKRERIRELNEQKLRTDVFDSQLKAIRSQMNPHFIFNSLNSIQALVLRQDTEKSYDYIVMFSDLVRKTLTFSEQEYVPLQEETDFLEIYLKLETLRMKEAFSYSIETKGIDSIQIPSLLIQPFLENSIHHGLLHKEGKKQLTVIYECSNNSASCTIIDNGIGREKAKKIKERQNFSHTSFSLNAVKQRLQILSQQNNQSYRYEFEDLFDESGNASGTKVIVKFPFKHDF